MTGSQSGSVLQGSKTYLIVPDKHCPYCKEHPLLFNTTSDGVRVKIEGYCDNCVHEEDEHAEELMHSEVQMC